MRVEHVPGLSQRSAIPVIRYDEDRPSIDGVLSVASHASIMCHHETLHVHRYVVPSRREGPRHPMSRLGDAYFTDWIGHVAWDPVERVLYVEPGQLSDSLGRPLWRWEKNWAGYARKVQVMPEWSNSYARRIVNDVERVSAATEGR